MLFSDLSLLAPISEVFVGLLLALSADFYLLSLINDSMTKQHQQQILSLCLDLWVYWTLYFKNYFALPCIWEPLWVRNIFQFSSVIQSRPTVCDLMDLSTPGHPPHHQHLELTQTHVHWVGDAIQPSHPLSSPSPPTFNLSQHQSLFHWVSSWHQVAKILEFQLQHQSFQWTFRTDLL